MNRNTLIEVCALSLLVAIGTAVRIYFRDLPNFAPVAAIALFAGYFFRWKLVALIVPLSIMVLSDLVIGSYDWRMMAIVYGMLAMPVLWRGWLRRHFEVRPESWRSLAGPSLSLVGCCLVSSLLFFVVTNFGCWVFFGGYAHNASGLIECYASALPFFRNTLIGDAFFATALFGGYAFVVGILRRPVVSRDGTDLSPSI